MSASGSDRPTLLQVPPWPPELLQKLEASAGHLDPEVEREVARRLELLARFPRLCEDQLDLLRAREREARINLQIEHAARWAPWQVLVVGVAVGVAALTFGAGAGYVLR